jgi:hypothetical protein
LAAAAAERGRADTAAAAMALAGAGAAGCPTSMWMTRPPSASMRAAAAITSITMKAGTSLRKEGVISRRAISCTAFALCRGGKSAPLSPHLCEHFVCANPTIMRDPGRIDTFVAATRLRGMTRLRGIK